MKPLPFFKIHWIVDGGRTLLPKNSLNAIPAIGSEIRVSKKEFYEVIKVVWCLDEDDEFGQRVNIGLRTIK